MHNSESHDFPLQKQREHDRTGSDTILHYSWDTIALIQGLSRLEDRLQNVMKMTESGKEVEVAREGIIRMMLKIEEAVPQVAVIEKKSEPSPLLHLCCTEF